AATSTRPWPIWVRSRSSSAPTAPGRTARSSGSTAPCRPSGPTATSSPATSTVATPLHPGYTPTTLNAATAHSAASRPSAGCHQPDGRVQLDRTRRTRPGSGAQRPSQRLAEHCHRLCDVLAGMRRRDVPAPAWQCEHPEPQHLYDEAVVEILVHLQEVIERRRLRRTNHALDHRAHLVHGRRDP